MRLSEILKAKNIKVPLVSTEKTAAITELVTLLAENGAVKDAATVCSHVLEREATRTTGVGQGWAIPHCKSNDVPGLTIAVGRPASPIDFESIDGQPVDLILLLASPPDQTGPYIQTLAQITRLMNLEPFRRAWRSAATAQQMYDVLLQHEKP